MSELICPDMGAAGGCKRSTPPHQATPAQLPRILPSPSPPLPLIQWGCPSQEQNSADAYVPRYTIKISGTDCTAALSHFGKHEKYAFLYWWN